MNAVPPPSPDLDATLATFIDYATRAGHVVTRMMELELQAADLAAAALPKPTDTPATLAEAAAGGYAVDGHAAAMTAANPRVQGLNRELDRLTRGMRRCVALRRRLQTNWPRATAADSRRALLRGQVATAVARKIRTHAERDPDSETDEDAAERLFDDLDDRLDDPGLDAELQAFTVAEVADRVCRDIGLVASRYVPFADPAIAAPQSAPQGALQSAPQGALQGVPRGAPQSAPAPSYPPDSG